MSQVLIKLLRGNTAQCAAITKPAGVLVMDTQLNILYLHDGVTQGGHAILNGSSYNDLQSTINNLGIADISGLQAALNLKLDASVVGQANGVAPLGADGKIPAAFMPSYVDDVIEAADLASLPATGETGKIYVTLNSGKTYRWSGSTYIAISSSPGTTDEVAEGMVNKYFTNQRARDAFSAGGDLTYDSATGTFSVTVPVKSVNGKTGDVVLTKADVGLGNVDNYATADATAAAAMTATNLFMTPAGVRSALETAGLKEVGGVWELDAGLLV